MLYLLLWIWPSLLAIMSGIPHYGFLSQMALSSHHDRLNHLEVHSQTDFMHVAVFYIVEFSWDKPLWKKREESRNGKNKKFTTTAGPTIVLGFHMGSSRDRMSYLFKPVLYILTFIIGCGLPRMECDLGNTTSIN